MTVRIRKLNRLCVLLLLALAGASPAQDADRAVDWFRQHSGAIPRTGIIPANKNVPILDDAAKRARVIGLGEATHGSREFGDLRFSITRYLIERHGFRIVAIEASSNIISELASYISGASELTPKMSKFIDSDIWIGKRTRRELFEWVRKWNKAHPKDRIAIIGVDPQIHVTYRQTVGSFLKQAYGEDLIKRWEPVEKNLAEADAQTVVFGFSGVDPATRAFLFELVEKLRRDESSLQPRFGMFAYDWALQAAEGLSQFADFNTGEDGRSRDWYMAKRTLSELAPSQKLVLWAHNAHVAHAASRYRTTGDELRDTLGCEYAAFAVTFDEGSFIAQIRNDPTNRLKAFTLPLAQDDSIESVVRKLGADGKIAAWPCGENAESAEWFRKPRPMHWVGGIYRPDSLPSASFQNFDLLHDFDGLVYLPRVRAEDVPKSIPTVPPRKR
jgi:erythromycin esterase